MWAGCAAGLLRRRRMPAEPNLYLRREMRMSLRVKRMAAAGAGLLRKAIPTRVWRRYAVGTIVVALAATGTVTAIGAQPAQAAHVRTVQTAAPARHDACTAPASPE